MEIQLQELIDKIKKDGVEAAENQAEEIILSAKSEAKKIVAEAKKKADKILIDAKNENERMVKSSEEAIRQAGRNVLISFRESVARELEAVMSQKVSESYSPEQLTGLILKVVENWKDGAESKDLSVILGSNDLKELEEGLLCALEKRMKKGVTLKANDSLDGGFRIGVNEGKLYYDYSVDAVVEMMSSYLSPRVIALLKEAESNG